MVRFFLVFFLIYERERGLLSLCLFQILYYPHPFLG
jgi:hypothetical protein